MAYVKEQSVNATAEKFAIHRQSVRGGGGGGGEAKNALKSVIKPNNWFRLREGSVTKKF